MAEITEAAQREINKVAEPDKVVKDARAAWQIARDLLGGTSAMRAGGAAYMPKWPNEDDGVWANRVAVATLFPAYSRTVKTLTGKPFSKPIAWSAEPSANIKKWCEDVDLQGRNLHVFASEVTETAIGYGIAGILVDAPTVRTDAGQPKRQLTQAEEQAQGIRPYMVQIYPYQLLGWKSKRRQGVETLLQLRFTEYVCEDDGEFGEVHVEQIKVLEPGKWRIYRQNEKKDWFLFDEGVTSIDVVPFIPVYGNRTDYMMGSPPMLELAYMNIKHWQSQSDQDTILHVARVPILAVTGVDDTDKKFQLVIGGSHAVKLPLGAEMKFVEHTGAAIDSGKVSLDDLKEEMRQAGAELLVLKPGSITATQVNTEEAVGMCDLQRIVQGIQDAIDQALALMGKWTGESQTGKSKVFNDFGALVLAEASASVLQTMCAAGQLSRETLLAEVKRRGIIAPDVDLTAEKDRIAADGPPLGTLKEPPA